MNVLKRIETTNILNIVKILQSIWIYRECLKDTSETITQIKYILIIDFCVVINLMMHTF